MEFKKSLLALAVTSAVFGLAGCSDDDDDNGSSSSQDTTKSFQQEFADSKNFDVTQDPSGIDIDSDTLAITGLSTAPDGTVPSGFDDAGYHGAVDPNANAPAWWDGWTYKNAAVDGNLPAGNNSEDFHPLSAELNNDTLNGTSSASCPIGTANGTVDMGSSKPFHVCELSSDITSDVKLTNDHVYVLTQTINVGDGGAESGSSGSKDATLTIEPGTMVMGKDGSDDVALVVTRDSKIHVDGTADMPVIMGSWDPTGNGKPITDLTDRGAWGGLIVDGNGVVNSADSNNNAASEAVPDGEDRYFGGNDNTDSSGYIRYLVIAESGYAFNEDQEVQGLTLEGVGRGSDKSGEPFIDYLQVLGSEDDGIEWFGGAAGGKHIVVNGQDDDGLDQDLGWQGNIQYAIVRMGSENGDRAMETDGNGDNFDATPYTMPNIANLTVLGNKGKDDKSTLGHLAREGYRGNIYRSVYIDDSLAGGQFDGACLDVDEMEGSSWLSTEALTYTDVVFSCAAGSLADADD